MKNGIISTNLLFFVAENERRRIKMVFSSLIFLCAFLPSVLIVYNLSKNITYKNIVLLLFSLLFYAWGEPKWIIVMIITSIVDYAAGRLIDKNAGKAAAKVYMVLSVVITLGVLIVFKYLNFFTHVINSVPFISVKETSISLPIGISFYTFQAMSYVIDVYRGKVPVQRKYSSLLLYVSMFPQLIAGPIVRYSTISEQISSRSVTLEQFSDGITRFAAGLAKKVVLANYLGLLVDTTLNSDLNALSSLGAWTGLLAYFFQIYFDFSGYSDMAVGMGKMLGFTFEENFDYPYTASSITQFWRKWHISLGSFFRDYVYIPLGGNRKFQLRNMLVVWLLTGFWHGASWNFLIWGFYYFLLLAFEKYILKGRLEKAPAFIGRIYTVFFVLVGWVFFYFDDMTKIPATFKTLFGFSSNSSFGADAVVLKNNLILFAVCIAACIPIGRFVSNLKKRIAQTVSGTIAVNFVTVFYQITLLFISVSCLVGSTYNPFLYFRF